MKALKIVLQVVLIALAGYLAYACYNSIETPQQFKIIKEQREARVIQRLKDIRSAQEAYKSLYGKYTSSFDELIRFVKNDSVKAVRSIGALTDDQIEAGMTEHQAIKEGIIIRDTVKVQALEDIRQKCAEKKETFCADYPIEDIRYVPFTKKEHEFKMGTKIQYSDNGTEIPLFEARVSYSVMLGNLGEEYENLLKQANGEALRLNKYPGLKVGDINEANNNVGNWQ